MDKSICIEKIFTEVDFYDRFAEVAKEGFSHVEFWSWSTKDLGRVTAGYLDSKTLADLIRPDDAGPCTAKPI